MRKYLHFFDRVVIGYVTKLPDWTRPFMLLMTLLGQPPITVGAAMGIIGYGVARSNWHLVTIGGIAIGTIAVCSVLKVFLRRARPQNEYVRSMLLQTFSFPSGHATGALVSFGLIAYISTFIWPDLAMLAFAIAFLLSFFIGVSRIYLGAHYPSDVIGGWIVGAIGLIAIVSTGV